MQKYLLFILILITAFVQGCAKPVETEHESVYYKELGDEYFAEKKYKEAVKAYENALMRAESPEEASQIQLALANSYFFLEEYIEAIPVYEVYLDYYGDAPEANIAILRIGLAHYYLISTNSRDQTETEMALKYFEQLKTRDPALAKDHNLDAKIVEVRSRLAEKEYIVARYYGRIWEDKPSMLRYKYLVDHYPESDRVEISLYRLIGLLIKFDRLDEADYYFNQLKKRFPQSSYISNLEKKFLKTQATK